VRDGFKTPFGTNENVEKRVNYYSLLSLMSKEDSLF
jgi:hypothetical protein